MLFTAHGHYETHYVTHRHYSKRRVDNSCSDSGIHGLCYTSCLKDACGKVKDLHK